MQHSTAQHSTAQHSTAGRTLGDLTPRQRSKPATSSLW